MNQNAPLAAGSAFTARHLAVAFAIGAAAVLLVVTVVAALGLLPVGVADFVLYGAGAALVAAALGQLLHACLPRRAVGAVPIQTLVAGTFVLKLVLLTAGVVVLRACDAKFEASAAFAVAFAAASLVFQIPAASYLMANASRRLHGHGAGSHELGSHELGSHELGNRAPNATATENVSLESPHVGRPANN